MKVYLMPWDELYPYCTLETQAELGDDHSVDDELNEVPDADVERWQRVIAEFQDVQREMFAVAEPEVTP
jgi:hypothetical protein